MRRPNVIIEAGLTGNPFNGHFHYCKNLGLSLLKGFGEKYNFLFLLMNNNNIFRLPEPSKVISYRVYKYFRRFFYKTDIWHITYQLTDLLPLESKTKILLTIHDLNFLKEKSEAEIPHFLTILQQNIDRASSIVAISNYVKSDIEKHCILNGKEIQVIYNGCSVNDELISSLQETSIVKRDTYIYSIGVIARKKNIHVLPYLLIGNDLKLIISGFVQDHDYYASILDIVKTLHLENRVCFTGPVSDEDKFRYMRDCALFAFPSFAEGFGLPVIEAMRFGKKTLLSKHTSLPEIGGELAFYLENEEEEYLRHFALNDLPLILGTPADSVKISEWAKQFSWTNAAAEYEKLYQFLADKP
ncbi:glycosyltransferase family 4 protein [Sphingobacterium alkalisoli]|uniref:Glycosyltransferase family 4 protein n=2 Tax=Sphingobacterium alkalisoli TaxID=1874115 RepID=A0A4U0GMR6_9SPHI|nr:glycosyltransferase family 4 protein [Sphingobacterium alkalisoli]GGH32166.1 glycosyl transferase [Sphingobacterium alkalisoli]